MSSNSAVIPSDQVCIELYPVLDGYVGHLKLTPEVCAKVMAVSNVIADQSSVETVVLLDRSMSMGGQTKRLVNQVFPQVLQRLNASPDAKMTIVAFDDEAVFMQATAEELTKSDLRARGGTLLSTGLRMLGEYLVPDSESEAKDTPAPAPAAAGSSSSQKKKLMQENVFSSLDDPLRRPSRELRPDEPLLIEVAFIVDCTASMGSWIQTVHETVFKLVEQVKLECQTTRDISPRVRIAFVAYRDFCDGEHMRFATLDFTEDVAAFKRWVLANAGAYGGDDVPEDVFGGLDKALKLSWSSDAQARIALLVADAPCHWHNHGDSSLSLAFPDPFRDPELQQQLLEAFALKRINLSFTRINAQTDAMITRFQEHYYNEQQLGNKPIKVLQLGQRVERFLPSVLGMITSSVAGADGTSPIVPTTTRKPSKQLRLLVLSDGEIEDMHTTLLAASELQNKIVRSGYTVNAQAIRFFTSAEQPDTRGLSAVLQFNTLVPAQLVDIDGLTQSNDGLVEQIVRLVEQDGLSQSHTLSVSAGDAPVLQSTPWEVPQTSLVLTPGSNTFWLPNMPVKMLMLDGHVSVTVKLADGRFDEETYARILGAKIDYFMQKLRVLKVVGGDATSAKLNEMLAYFERLDKFVATEQAQTLVAAASASAGSVKITPNSIRSRMIALQVELARKKTSVSMRMKEIANDARIGLLNAKQAAEFLRNVGAESKAIARRADKAGLDVDGTLSTEMAAIADHIHELDDLSDDDHVKSLYSQETTLGGLRAVAELAQKERLNLAEISADSILLLLNIVGVACKAPIGGFPDPMTYRIDRMFLSSPLSLSDILQAHLQSGGVTPLTALGSTQPDRDTIDNVVPVFDDERLHHFYRKYAPKLLEMHASVGMRRLVTMVNMTHSYTIVAGVWSMVFELNREAPGKRTELQARMWINLLDTFRVAIGDYFKHVLPHVRKPATPIEQDKLTGPASFYLLNNGITNAISPLMTWIKDQGGLIACANIGAILRALYTFEIRQAIKRFVKKQVPENERDKTDVHAAQLLRQLLGIDISRYKTKVPALFDEAAAAVSPLLHDQVIVDDNLLDKMLDEFWYLDHVCLLPLLIEAALIPSTAALRIAACNAVPTLDDALCHKMLELPPTMTLRQFKLLNIVQAIRFPTKASRIDHVNECMKIPDLAHKMAAEADLCAFVRKHYEDAYSSDMQLRRKEERNLLMEELIEQMVKAPDMATFCSLFRQGLSRGGTKVVIDTPAALGYVELRQALLARPPNSFAIPDHIEKAAVLLLGCQRSGSGSGDKSPVWNNGRTLYLSDISVYDESFASADEWQELKRQHRDLYKHVYRNGKPNHQGHSNKKPSYWALGYATLYDFERNASANEIADYRSKHTACCGLGSATKLKARKAAIRAMLEREV